MRMKAAAALRWGRRLGLVVLVLALLVPAVAAGCIWYVAREDSHPRSDAIVVLGASQYDGRPSPVFEARLSHAADLYWRGVAPRIVTVGGSLPGDRYTEAGSGKRWLYKDEGIPADRLIAVPEGHDTLQSMRALRREFRAHGWTTAVVVTDPWHSLRARTMADDVGIKAATSPARTGPVVRRRWIELRYIVRETGAYLYYLLFHSSPSWSPEAVG